MNKEEAHIPPRTADRLLTWYCGRAFVEDLQGDMHELYCTNLKRMSPRRARLRYWQQTFSLLLSHAVKHRKQKAAYHPFAYSSNHYVMLLNYFKVGFRNLTKHRSYSLINIAGLSIAVSLSIVIALFVEQELAYDQHYPTADRIFRVHYENRHGENHDYMATTPAVAATALQQDFREIESTVRLGNFGSFLVKASPEHEGSKEYKVLWTDSTFFKVFPIQLLQGDPNVALSMANSVAISRHIAEKYFDQGDALGKSLLLDNVYQVTVSAVYENFPYASHFHPDILIAFAGNAAAARQANATVFANNNFNTYLLLREGANVRNIEASLPRFLSKYVDGLTVTDHSRLSLMPVTDIHLYSDLSGELEANSNIVYIYLFSGVGILIIAIACINFMNLSTALSARRAREVGIRKVMGSFRSTLIKQFLIESALLTSIAFLVAVLLTSLALPEFNTFFQTKLIIPFDNPLFYLLLVAAIIVISMAAGAYPAFFLSGFKPAHVLKGNAAGGKHSILLRGGMVVFQFVVSIMLIVGALTIRNQLVFIQHKTLGFEKHHVLMIRDAYLLRPNVSTFRTEAQKIASVESCTISAFVPVQGGADYPRRDRTFWKAGDAENYVTLQQWSVDEDYLQTFKIKLVQGRNFSAESPADAGSVILNRAAIKSFGLGEDPIGKTILTFSGNEEQDFQHPQEFTVIGVVEDFHFSSLKQSIAPLAFFRGRSDGFISVRFQGDPDETIAELKKVWKAIAPHEPFQFTFLDSEFGRMYANEQRLSQIFGAFSILAIVIACFGLLALTAYTAQHRTREIGIRKVMGASTSSIMLLLTSQFNRLLLLAFVIAFPLSWMGVQWWLQSFTYKADIGAVTYITAGLLTTMLTWITTAYHLYRAAGADPIQTLRGE